MNAPPPPPASAPPPAPPPPPLLTTSRHAQRQQRRAAALAARQQRLLYRAQRRALRRRSVLGPVLLIALGIAFLASETLHFPLQLLLFWLGRNWPLLLVACGLVLLAEWALDRRSSTSQGLTPPRRTLGFASTLLLVLLVLFGISAARLSNLPRWLPALLEGDAENGMGFAQLLGQHSEVTRELSAPLAAGQVLVISNYRGKIAVTGSSQDGQVHVTAHQHTAAWQNGDLHRREQRNQPTFVPSDGHLALNVEGSGQDETDLVVGVPHVAAVNITPETGDITVSELRGPLTIADHRGGLTLTGLTGPVDLTLHDDDAGVSAHSITGDLTLHGHAGDLALSDLEGNVHLEGDFFGTTHLEHVKGTVLFQSSFTRLSCAGIPGTLDIDGRSDLSASGVQGPLLLATTDRSLDLKDIRSGATITNKNGSVHLSLAEPLGATNVTTSSGSVQLVVPKTASFHLSAAAQEGDIETAMLHGVLHHDGSASLEGVVGHPGPKVPEIHLQASEGDISLNNSETEDAD